MEMNPIGAAGVAENTGNSGANKCSHHNNTESELPPERGVCLGLATLALKLLSPQSK